MNNCNISLLPNSSKINSELRSVILKKATLFEKNTKDKKKKISIQKAWRDIILQQLKKNGVPKVMSILLKDKFSEKILLFRNVSLSFRKNSYGSRPEIILLEM